MIRVVIVDDHAFLLRMLQTRLDLQEDIEVVATFSDGTDLLAHLRRLAPDVILTDLRMPNHEPLALVRAMAQELPTTRVAVMTSSVDVGLFRHLLEAGVAAIQLKTDLRDAVQLVYAAHRGERYLSPDIAHLAAE